MRSVKTQHQTIRDDIDDLVTRRALPTGSIQHLDPFLFLNHHGPQVYASRNNGLPFGPHPHRGFETVTFILEGSLAHKDSGGHESIIHAGGVQWMTAGRGLVHSEISPKEFKDQGGPLEILQLWINLPSRLKMTDPKYVGLQKNQIPRISHDNGLVSVDLVSGNWEGHQGAFNPLVDIHLMTVHFKRQGKIRFEIPVERDIFFYVVRGELKVNGVRARQFELVEFNRDGTEIEVEALQDSILLFGHAKPFQEPIVSHGPFVMNTREEILQAFMDYQAGKFE